MILTAFFLGLSAAISPGPLMTLMISETLKYGKGTGIKMAVAPLLTDFPILVLSIFVLSSISRIHFLLGLISLLGALFLGYLGYESIMTKHVHIKVDSSPNKSILKGVIVNFLNPHPYLFFFSIGGPIILRGMKEHLYNGPLFVITFWTVLIASNICIVLLVHRSRGFLESKLFVNILRILGVILVIFAALFLKESLGLFGILK